MTHDGEAFVLRFGTGGPTLAPDLRVPVLVNCTGLVGGPDASAGPLYPSLIAGGSRVVTLSAASTSIRTPTA